MKISMAEFEQGVIEASQHNPTLPSMKAALEVHVFNIFWLRNVFWPVWDSIKWEYKSQQNQPLENNAVRGTCDEIAKRCVSYLIEASRKLHGDSAVGAGVFEANVLLLEKGLNGVMGPGGHRTVIVAVTENDETWYPLFVEQQLTRANYVDKTVKDACVDCVLLMDLFV